MNQIRKRRNLSLDEKLTPHKIPKERKKRITGPNLQSKWPSFYKEVKDKPFLEDISLD